MPVGAYTREVLGRLPDALEEKILANVRSEEPDVKGVVGKLTQGAADAGFVYLTDVTDGITGVELPPELRPTRRLRRGRSGGVEAARARPAVPRRAHRGALRGRAARGGVRAAAGRMSAFRAVLVVSLALALVFLALPVLAIFVDQPPSDLLSALGEPGALDALWLSLRTTAAALAIIVLVGTPAAYLLATRRFRGRTVAITLIELPLVLPPAVAGIALLATVGPSGILGGLIEDSGVRLTFETAGVVVALTFVAAPFYVRQAQAAFMAIDPRWLEASRTLGVSEGRTFARVAVPTAASGLLAGGALALGRALGEFGPR